MAARTSGVNSGVGSGGGGACGLRAASRLTCISAVASASSARRRAVCAARLRCSAATSRRARRSASKAAREAEARSPSRMRRALNESAPSAARRARRSSVHFCSIGAVIAGLLRGAVCVLFFVFAKNRSEGGDAGPARKTREEKETRAKPGRPRDVLRSRSGGGAVHSGAWRQQRAVRSNVVLACAGATRSPDTVVSGLAANLTHRSPLHALGWRLNAPPMKRTAAMIRPARRGRIDFAESVVLQGKSGVSAGIEPAPWSAGALAGMRRITHKQEPARAPALHIRC